MKINFIVFTFLIMILTSCSQGKKELPILGQAQISEKDTIPHHIMDFALIDQDSQMITNQSFQNDIYIADFFFTSCPTICPKVKQQTLRIAEKFKNEERLHFISHSIDHRKDSVPVLKDYAEKLDLPERWHLVEVHQDSLEDLALNYLSVAYEDEYAPGGFNHSGNLILVDKNRHIRSFCDGTQPDDVDRFMEDIKLLLDEMDH